MQWPSIRGVHQCHALMPLLKLRPSGSAPQCGPLFPQMLQQFPQRMLILPNPSSYTNGHLPMGRCHFQMSAYDALTQTFKKLKKIALLRIAHASASLAIPLASVFLLLCIQHCRSQNKHLSSDMRPTTERGKKQDALSP